MSKIDPEMRKGCWKIGENDEAWYIDVESDDDDNDPNRVFSQWCDLPDLLLETIFAYLNIQERYYASMVCKNWYRAFHLPPVWSNFIVNDRTLTHPKYNYYSGWQYTLDHLRTQNCISRVGHYIKGLDFRPEQSFNNLYQFMTLLTWCMDKSKEKGCMKELIGVGENIKSLKYVFPCNMSHRDDPEGMKLFGTGGQLLSTLKKLMSRLVNLTTLQLVDLVLDRFEANHLLDEVLESCLTTLRVLHVINVTLVHCPIMHVGLFLNLQVLVISPQNVDNETLALLENSKVEHLHLLQNIYTPASNCISPCSQQAWESLRRNNTSLHVHIRFESMTLDEIVFQPKAPVYSIVYHTPYTKITTENIVRLVENYRGTLTVFGHELLPKFSSPKPFHNRIDSSILLLARQCVYLTTLVIREKISTATTLLIAKTAENLRHFYVRQNAVILRCDWPRNPEWSSEFYYWLRQASKTYESTEREVSQILGVRWTFLNDKEFKNVTINPRIYL